MKKTFLRFLSVLLALQGVIAAQLLTVEPAKANHDGTPHVVINEVMWMGSTLSASDEWLELRNTTDSPIDLSGWKLTHAGTADTTLVISTGTIPAEGYFLISNFASGSSVISDLIIPNWVTSSLALLNSCVQIDLVMPDDTVVDSMGCDGSDYFFPASSATKHALERNLAVSDGTLSSSWHERTAGSANLDVSVTDLATPQFVNDVSPAETAAATVNDGLSDDVNWSDDTDEASVNWGGFADLESDLSGTYNVALLDELDNVLAAATVVGTSTTFNGLTLDEGEQYHFAVSAFNNVGLESLPVESDGFVIDSTLPEPATDLTVTDVAGDNGGSVLVEWSASPSQDEIAYRVEYRKVGDVTVLSQDAGSLLETTITGLENSPSTYEFTVIAVDFSDRESVGNPAMTAAALDNLAPIINPAKVMLSQKKPGSSDTISGKAGSANEPATVTVFDRHPSEPVKTTIASVLTDSNLGFSALSLGDNLYGAVWVQLVDASGNASAPVKFSNDIVAPESPTITSVTATCYSQLCQVELNWEGDSADTDHYRVRYGAGNALKTSLPVDGNELTLGVEGDGSLWSFAVIAYDRFGNASELSNQFANALVPGVVVKATLSNGKLVATTTALPGGKGTITENIPRPPVKLVPPAQASDGEENGTTDVASQQDWQRIAVVIVLLLIVAGGFYALSRSMQKPDRNVPVAAVPVQKTTAKPAAKRGRGRPKRKRVRK